MTGECGSAWTEAVALGEQQQQQTGGNNAATTDDENVSDEVTQDDPQPTVVGYDGDEGVTRQHFVQLKQAFDTKNSPNLSFEVNKDICRRMCNIFDKGRAEGRSIRFTKGNSPLWVLDAR